MYYNIKNLDELCNTLKEDGITYTVQKSDKSFKNLLEVKSQFIELIRTFINEPWVNKISEDNIELADKEFILSNYRARTADIIYRLKIDKNYLYFFLLELQSSVDKDMPYRLYEYMSEIWRRHHLDNPNKKLPIIIPCVLYTGQEKWNVKDFRSMFPKAKEFYEYIPNFKYILIDINKYSDNELEHIANLISSVFFIAKSKDENDILERLKKLKYLKKEDIRPFINWCEIMFLGNENVYEYIDTNLKEDDETMSLVELGPKFVDLCHRRGLAQGLEQGRKEGKIEGKIEGILEGKIEGILEGKQEGKLESKKQSVLKLLPKRLNCILPLELQKSIQNASLEKLEEIEDKIFEISSLDDVKVILNNIK